MSGHLLMGLDVGGGGGRCLLLDSRTGALTSASCRWSFPAAPGTSGLGSDLDVDAVWRSLCDVTREALARAGASGADIAGIAATSIRLGCVVIDAHGEALFSVPNRDARAVMEGLTMAAQHGERVMEQMGRWPYPIYPAARLGWLKANAPDAFARAHALLSISDWVTYKLCGECVVEPSQCGETLLFDLASRDWAWDWIEELELPRRLFPRVSAAGEIAGQLAPEAAGSLGLPAGIPIALGGGDSQCALLGTGSLEPGVATLVAGTTAPVQIVVDRPVVDDQGRCWSGHHIVADRWLVESNAGPLGETLDWFSQLLFPDSAEPVVRLLGEASLAQPGARGMLSTLGAEIMNAKSMGLPLGTLTLSHMACPTPRSGRPNLARSVLEGMACAVRANLEQAREVAGTEAQGLRVTGGLTRSQSWLRMLGEVLGEPIEVSSTFEATGLGAALCAGVGAGVYSDLAAAAATQAHRSRLPEPAEQNVTVYASIYAAWRRRVELGAVADAQSRADVMPWAIGGDTDQKAGATGSHRPRILVAADLDDASLEALRDLGEVEYASFRDEKRMLAGDTLIEALNGVEVFVTEIDLVDAISLRALPELRVVVACRGDAVNVDRRACTAFGVPLLRCPGRNADAVADLTLAFLLMLARELPAATAFLRTGDIRPGDMRKMGQAFAELRGRELWRKTVGLVGFGAVGRQVARRAAAFGARVIVADPYVDPEAAARFGAQRVSLETLLGESDFISLHAAVTEETRGMIGAAELSAMKPSAALVNTARAALVDQDALVAALEGGRIAGAALDTFAVEPPGSDDPLLSLDRVIVTPHVGGNTQDVAAHQGAIVVSGLRRLLRGEAPEFIVNPETLDAFRWSGRRPEPSNEQLAALEGGVGPAVSDLARDAGGSAAAKSPRPE